jgi:hypothetical protein
MFDEFLYYKVAQEFLPNPVRFFLFMSQGYTFDLLKQTLKTRASEWAFLTYFFPENGQKLPINHNYIEFWKTTVIKKYANFLSLTITSLLSTFSPTRALYKAL